jgi:ribosomal small subunit protein bTHX
MGRGDKRSKKGKITLSSYGNSRLKSKSLKAKKRAKK